MSHDDPIAVIPSVSLSSMDMSIVQAPAAVDDMIDQSQLELSLEDECFPVSAGSREEAKESSGLRERPRKRKVSGRGKSKTPKKRKIMKFSTLKRSMIRALNASETSTASVGKLDPSSEPTSVSLSEIAKRMQERFPLSFDTPYYQAVFRERCRQLTSSKLGEDIAFLEAACYEMRKNGIETEWGPRVRGILAEIKSVASAEMHNANGNLLFKQETFTAAIEEYNLAIKFDATCAKYFGNRAAASLMVGAFSNADSDCERAIALDPAYLKPYPRLVRARLSLGDSQGAEKALFAFRSQLLIDNQMVFASELAELEVLLSGYETIVAKCEAAINCESFEEADHLLHVGFLSAPASWKLRVLQFVVQIGRMIHPMRHCQLPNSNTRSSEGTLRFLESEIMKLLSLKASNDTTLGEAKYRNVTSWTVIAISYLADRLYCIGMVNEAMRCAQIWVEIAGSRDPLAISALVQTTEMMNYLKRTEDLRQRSAFLDAVELISHCLDRNTSSTSFSARIYGVRANLNFGAGRIADALLDCNKALHLSPGFKFLYILRASLCMSVGDAASVRTAVSDLEFANADRAIITRAKCRLVEAEAKERAEHSKNNEENRRRDFESRFRFREGKQHRYPFQEHDVNAAALVKPETTHYSLLGVSCKASKEEIRKAYKSLALKYHPDKNGNDQKCEETFKSIAAAYRVLSSPGQRRGYDSSRGSTRW